MIANVRPEIQIVDTHELPGNLINIAVAVGVSKFNRTLVMNYRNHYTAKKHELGSATGSQDHRRIALKLLAELTLKNDFNRTGFAHP